MMDVVDDNSKWYLLPFAICGIAAVLSMYRRTRKIGYCLFIITFFGAFFIGMPILALILGTADVWFAIIFIIVGIVMGIYTLMEVLKGK